MAHAYNPSYSGGRDQKDDSSNPAQVNSSQQPILKIPSTKRVSSVAHVVGPEFKPGITKKKKRRDFHIYKYIYICI
jgi:hypothetical protein